jgi:hypothetical protein
MKLLSHRIITSLAGGIIVMCAVVLFTRAETAQAETAEGEAPTERAWWAFQQRAYPLGYIPSDAQMRALRQIHDARAARASIPRGGAAAGNSDRWVNIGPAPILDKRPVSGRVATIAVDPRDAQRWLIGAAQGGIWESRDAGTTWTAKTDAAASLAMGKIAFAPGDPGIIYAGTGEAAGTGDIYAGAGLLKSVDAGATWQLLDAPIFSGVSFSSLQIDPKDARIVVAATRSGYFGKRFPVQLPVPPQTGIFKSADGGATWSNRLIGAASAVEVDPGNFSRQFAAIGAYTCVDRPIPCVGAEPPNAVQNGLYRSTDAGDSWTLMGGPWDAQAGGVGRVVLALAPSNPNVLYVSIQDAYDPMAVGHDNELLGLWKTTNAWDPSPSWTQIDVSQTDGGTGLHGYCGWGVDPQDTVGVKAQCDYDHALLVDQSDPDILYAAGVPLWRFDGTTWTEISRTGDAQHGIHVDQQTLAWVGDRLIVGNDGGLWSTTDDGGTWTDHNTDLAITQFYKGALHPTNPNFALAGSQDNGFEKWTGADPWQLVAPFDGLDVAVSSSQPDTRWALATEFLTLSRTEVGHGGRVLLVPAANGIDLRNAGFGSGFEKCSANEDVFLAGTNTLWRTTDFFSAPRSPGPTWLANSPAMGECGPGTSGAGCIAALAFAASDATCSTYAFATGDGRLRRTVDAGSTWDDLDVGNAVPNRWVTDLAFAPTDANILYVTLSGFDDGTPGQPGHVFKTMNALAGAPAWSDVSPPVDQPHNTIAVDPVDPQVVYVGADIGVWQSSDGAATWTHMGPESGMPNVAVYDLEIRPAARRRFAFTHGRGAFALACHSDAECDDQNASNGVETCDLVSGRCEAGVAPPTASPTATPFATFTGTATPTATVAATATPTASATITNTVTATATRTPSPTVTAILGTTPTASPTLVPTQTHTAVPTATPTRAMSGNGSGCAIAPVQHADAAAGIWLFWIVPFLWRARCARRSPLPGARLRRANPRREARS